MLTESRQTVQVEVSELVISTAPQGTVLGPLLSIIMGQMIILVLFCCEGTQAVDISLKELQHWRHAKAD